ncbi:hypothetical protein D918_09294 [Trichuris suis]|nr:hypothetical protein D918_09294 [Trichuris suis]
MHVCSVVAVWIGIVLAFATCETEDCEFVRIERPSENGGPTLVRCLKLLTRNSEIDYLLKRNRSSNVAVTIEGVCRKHCDAGRLAGPETVQNAEMVPRKDLILIGRRQNRKNNWEVIGEMFKETVSTFRSKKRKLAIVSEAIEPLCIRYNKEEASSAISYYQCNGSRPWQAVLCECDVEITCEIEKPCTYKHLGDICQPAAYKWPSAAASVCPALQCTCNPCEGTEWTSWAQTATCGLAISYRFRPENRSVETSCHIEDIKRSSACCTQLVNTELGSCSETELRRQEREASGELEQSGDTPPSPAAPPAEPEQTNTDTPVVQEGAPEEKPGGDPQTGKSKKSKPKQPLKDNDDSELGLCDDKR